MNAGTVSERLFDFCRIVLGRMRVVLGQDDILVSVALCALHLRAQRNAAVAAGAYEAMARHPVPRSLAAVDAASASLRHLHRSLHAHRISRSAGLTCFFFLNDPAPPEISPFPLQAAFPI